MKKIKEIAEWFQNFGITLYQVGGSVRDELMGNPVEDVDVCIVGGKTFKEVDIFLSDLCVETGLADSYTPVHGSFPIWIVEIEGEKYEFAMARKERKVGQSRQEFECEVNNVTIEEDLMRRDLTINAIAKNIVTGEIVDPFGGVKDIKEKYLHPVGDAFSEDPLRVVRAARFWARFPDFTPTDSLFLKSRGMTRLIADVSKERIGMELMKTLKTAKKPSNFFEFLRIAGWCEELFPELYACLQVPQSPLHHPEGDVWCHTMHCIDAAEGWFYRAVMLCHDLGKATTTSFKWPDSIEYVWTNRGDLKAEMLGETVKITAHGHEEAGVQLTKDMLKRIFFTDHKTIDQIACLVELHMIRAMMTENNYDKIIRRSMRKLMKYGLFYYQLMNVISYDLQGRPPKQAPDDMTLFFDLHGEHASNLHRTNAMKPIVTGERLIARGMLPGPEMGKIISHALELQDRGTLKESNWQKVLKGCGYKFFQTKKEI